MTEPLSEHERVHYNAIKDLESKIRDYDVAYQMAKAKAHDAKKDLELAIIDLRLCISKGPDPQKKLDFNTDWEGTPIQDAIDLTAKQLERLHEAGIWNVGEFERVRAGRCNTLPGGLTQINGIGQSHVDKWESQIVEWMLKNAKEESSDDEQQEPGSDD